MLRQQGGFATKIPAPEKQEMLTQSEGPSKLEILLEGDVVWAELTPASHIIKRAIKKLIMFGKSLIICSTLASA